MDPQRSDYDDLPGRRRRPWTLIQVAILIVIVLLSLPPLAVVVVLGLILLSGGMQH